MQYKITCPACHQQLTVNPGWEGQQVNCPLCTAPFVMPGPPEPFVAQAPKESKVIAPPPPPKLWNPNAAANWSVLFGPVFGTAIHYLNWSVLKDEAKTASALKWLYAAVVVSSLTVLNVISGTDSEAALPLNLGFLGAWYFLSAKTQITHVKERLDSRYDRRSWLKPLGIALGCLIALISAGDSVSPSPATASRQTAAHIYQLSGEDALEAARKHMVGTWTYTGPNYPMLRRDPYSSNLRQTPGWFKWVVNPDGTMLKFKALPTADDWGQGVKVNWDVSTGKFNNTGRRYFQFNPGSIDILDNPVFREAILISLDGTLEFRLDNDSTIIVERGDKFPFSK